MCFAASPAILSLRDAQNWNFLPRHSYHNMRSREYALADIRELTRLEFVANRKCAPLHRRVSLALQTREDDGLAMSALPGLAGSLRGSR